MCIRDRDRVDDEIKQDGGLDLVLMGIGTNGHFCGNQPETFKSWDEGVHTIDAHATKVIEDLMVQLLHEDLNSDDETRIPEHYITMGPKTIMAANSIVFIPVSYTHLYQNTRLTHKLTLIIVLLS